MKNGRIEVLVNGEWKAVVNNVPTLDFNMENFEFQDLTPEEMIRRHFVQHYKYKEEEMRVIIEEFEVKLINTETHYIGVKT